MLFNEEINTITSMNYSEFISLVPFRIILLINYSRLLEFKIILLFLKFSFVLVMLFIIPGSFVVIFIFIFTFLFSISISLITFLVSQT